VICHGLRQPIVADDHRPIDEPGGDKLGRAAATDATPISGPPAHGRAFAALPAGCGLIADLLKAQLRHNGNTAGSAIVWTLHPTAGNANHATVAGTLQAYKADDLTEPLWSSNHDPRGIDDLGDFAKFCPPVVANGRVYVATFSQQLVVYGLLLAG
jgi:hypothetical protein